MDEETVVSNEEIRSMLLDTSATISKRATCFERDGQFAQRDIFESFLFQPNLRYFCEAFFAKWPRVADREELEEWDDTNGEQLPLAKRRRNEDQQQPDNEADFHHYHYNDDAGIPADVEIRRASSSSEEQNPVSDELTQILFVEGGQNVVPLLDKLENNEHIPRMMNLELDDESSKDVSSMELRSRNMLHFLQTKMCSNDGELPHRFSALVSSSKKSTVAISFYQTLGIVT